MNFFALKLFLKKDVPKILIVLLLLKIPIFSQQLLIQGGANYGRLYDFRVSDPHTIRSYEPQTGFLLNIALNELTFGKLKRSSISMGYERIGGEFSSGYYGLGGSTSKEGSFQKHLIDLEFYPWNIHFLKHFIFSPGFEINATLGSKIRGTYSQYQMGATNLNTDLDHIDGFVGPLNAGVNFMFGYEFTFQNLKLKPSYKFSSTLLPELNLETYAPFFRHSIIIGLGYTLNSKK